MSVTSIVVLAIIAIALIYTIMLYNNLVTIKHNVSKAWANIDVLLKQRHDELPKLVETCKQYMQYEQQTLEKVMDARSRVFSAREAGNVGAVGDAENSLRASIGNLFAVAENYPDLKTNDTFRQLQARITGLESEIADRREFYNDSVNINNVRIEQFPDSILAGLFGFKASELLQFGAAEMTDVDVGALFKA
jgi:LemA protein